jgi:ABC-type Fe3+ transport system substrate-binding protein
MHYADHRARHGPDPRLLVAVPLVGVLLLAGGLVWWLAARGDCEERRPVAVTVAPEIAEVAERVLAEPMPLGDGACAVAEVTARDPLQTVGDLGTADPAALPDVWVPDSSLWVARAGDAPLEDAGSMASSPVVLATSRAAAEELGWTDEPPSWGDAAGADRPLAVRDPTATAAAVAALAAVEASLGDEADDAIADVVLTASRDGAPTPEEALEAAATGGADAALVPVSEQRVLAADAGAENLVAVYPDDGSPVLDFPVLRVGSSDGDRAAVDAVVRALTSDAARAEALDAGFRGEGGAAPSGAGEANGVREAAPEPLPLEPAAVEDLLGRLAELDRPVRMLEVIDVSASMGDPVGNGTRATLARDAAKSALALFPDTSAVGLWVFARELEGGEDWVELVPTRNLDADAGEQPQRDTLMGQLDSVPGRLTPGGTGLFDTTLAAVRAAREDYDPAYVSSVVVITDGRDEDEGTIGLDRLVATLRIEADPDRPVEVIGVGVGPDADLGALQRIAEVTGGVAYHAVEERDMERVLFDALRPGN